MLITIEEIKLRLDSEIVDLTYTKLSGERFGTCVSKLDLDRLALLKDYQEIVDKLILQTSPMLPSEETEEVVTVVNTDTLETSQHILYTTVNYMGNCIKETITRTPFYNTDTLEVEYLTTTIYTQESDCTNIQSDINCIENLIRQIKSLV